MADFGVSSGLTGGLGGNTASLAGNAYAAFLPPAGYSAAAAGYPAAAGDGADDYEAYFVPSAPRLDSLSVTGKIPFILGATSLGFLIAILVLVAKAYEEGSLDAPKKKKPKEEFVSTGQSDHYQSDNYVRRKRGVDDASPYASEAHLARLTSIVMSALQSQECQQRMYCEMGSTMKTYGADRGIVFT